MSQSFQALGVSTSVVRALGQQNIHRPFAVQEQVLPDALGGLDILAESPTGSGKTLAFGIPLVERTQPQGSRPAALVLVPTRELATQVASDLRPLAAAKNLRVAAVYGGTSVGGQTKLARGANILIATPGRLNDLLERKMINLDNVRVLVLDEADRMLDMGFKPQVNRILAHVPRNRQTLLFSATLDGAVAELARDYTDNASRFRAELPAEREKGAIEHAFVPVTPDDKLDRLVEHLNAERGLALVFVRTKHGADKLVKKLARQNVSATAMHGNMSQNQRERSLSRFESGQDPDARRDRRRCTRPRHRRHHPRDQLRPAARRRGLRASRRPHRPRRPQRHRHHLRAPRAADGRRQARRPPRPRRRVRRLRHARSRHSQAEAAACG